MTNYPKTICCYQLYEDTADDTKLVLLPLLYRLKLAYQKSKEFWGRNESIFTLKKALMTDCILLTTLCL